jgi:nucleoside-diphosphate-sugar epimerase
MIILGLNAFHGDSAAALVRGGKLIAAAKDGASGGKPDEARIISEIITPRACCVWSRLWKTALAGRPINLPMQQGDVPATYSGVGDLACEIGFVPQTSLESGVEQFVRWYRSFYRV